MLPGTSFRSAGEAGALQIANAEPGVSVSIDVELGPPSHRDTAHWYIEADTGPTRTAVVEALCLALSGRSNVTTREVWSGVYVEEC